MNEECVRSGVPRNFADLAITAGTAVFGLALIWHASRLLTTHARPAPTQTRPTRPARADLSAPTTPVATPRSDTPVPRFQYCPDPSDKAEDRPGSNAIFDQLRKVNDEKLDLTSPNRD